MIPMPHLYKSDDHALIIEWVKEDRRLGISIELDVPQSSWYYVNKSGDLASGHLPRPLVAYLQEMFLEEDET